MANTKSAIKNNRKTIARTIRNRSRKTRLKTLAKKVQTLAAADDKDALKAAASEYASAMDKATKSNLISPNAASRAKSKVAKYFVG
tara:strand:+ start:176 stop:433 length:258 start_codon:yes stop_codon:yes gene_type:complete